MSDPMTTFRERVEALPVWNSNDVRETQGRSLFLERDAVLALCEDGPSGTDDYAALLDLLKEIKLEWTTPELLAETILASGFRRCEDSGTPDAWRNDPKVQACIGNLRAQGCCMEDYGAMGAENVILEGRKHFDALLDALCAAVAASSGGARDAGAPDWRKFCDHLTHCRTCYDDLQECGMGRLIYKALGRDAAMSPSPEPTK